MWVTSWATLPSSKKGEKIGSHEVHFRLWPLLGEALHIRTNSKTYGQNFNLPNIPNSNSKFEFQFNIEILYKYNLLSKVQKNYKTCISEFGLFLAKPCTWGQIQNLMIESNIFFQYGHNYNSKFQFNTSTIYGVVVQKKNTILKLAFLLWMSSMAH